MGLSEGEGRLSIGCGVPKIHAPQKRYGRVLSCIVGPLMCEKIPYPVRTRERSALARKQILQGGYAPGLSTTERRGRRTHGVVAVRAQR